MKLFKFRPKNREFETVKAFEVFSKKMDDFSKKRQKEVAHQLGVFTGDVIEINTSINETQVNPYSPNPTNPEPLNVRIIEPQLPKLFDQDKQTG